MFQHSDFSPPPASTPLRGSSAALLYFMVLVVLLQGLYVLIFESSLAFLSLCFSEVTGHATTRP